MTWDDVLADKSLQDLPYKIELNEYGQIVMSPASNTHALRAGDLGFVLRTELPEGRTLSECSVDTPLGVKVPDVAWISNERLGEQGTQTPFDKAPEICVEVMSPSNTRAEMREKVALYLGAGAHEVWICEPDGTLRFFTQEGEADTSPMVPEAPARL
jgi:Uma2 family endonuclease